MPSFFFEDVDADAFLPEVMVETMGSDCASFEDEDEANAVGTFGNRSLRYGGFKEGGRESDSLGGLLYRLGTGNLKMSIMDLVEMCHDKLMTSCRNGCTLTLRSRSFQAELFGK
jgi:hypothetical protein